MKIAVIGSKGLPPKQGGIEHYCAEVYPRMVAQGHSVDIFARCSYTESPWFQSYDFQGVRIIPFPALDYQGIDAFISSGLGAIASSGIQYDIIHFHALGPALFSGLSKFISKGKIVVTCHGLDWQRAKWGNFSSRLIYTGEKIAVRFADGIIVVSQDLQSYFLKKYNKQTVYIPTAPAKYLESDANLSYISSLGLIPKRYILFLGRLVPEKRPDLLIDAFSRLNAIGWKLVLVGGVSEAKSYASSLLDKISKNPNIVLAGELQGKKLWEIVRGAGLFALPSDLEGLPLAMMEAMQESIPVVASDILPHQQLLGKERERGVIFKAGNLDSCIHFLNWAISHPFEMAIMAKKAKEYTQLNYNWQQITYENLQLYANVLNLSHVNVLSPPEINLYQSVKQDVTIQEHQLIQNLESKI
jgi:glycosyltransferase involved in cell wall biosynthesis